MTWFAYGFTATVRRKSTTKNRWGDNTSVPPTHTVDGCAMYPQSSTELTEARDTLLDSAVLIAPAGADIRATDELVIPSVDAVPPPYRGTVWKVDGTPGDWRSPFTGWTPGMEVSLRREKG